MQLFSALSTSALEVHSVEYLVNPPSNSCALRLRMNTGSFLDGMTVAWGIRLILHAPSNIFYAFTSIYTGFKLRMYNTIRDLLGTSKHHYRGNGADGRTRCSTTRLCVVSEACISLQVCHSKLSWTSACNRDRSSAADSTRTPT